MNKAALKGTCVVIFVPLKSPLDQGADSQIFQYLIIINPTKTRIAIYVHVKVLCKQLTC